MLYRCDDARRLEKRDGCIEIRARDPSPALGFALDLINEILTRDYGVKIGGTVIIDPLGTSGDAVYYGGRKFGVIHYNPLRISLTPRGARVITRKRERPKGYVIVKRSAEGYIRRGYNVMAGGVKEAFPSLSWVIVLNEDLEPIAVGKRRGDRVAVMTRGVVEPMGPIPPERSWEYIVEVNTESLERKGKTARERIVKGVSGRPYVLYSGGKDSEVTLYLSQEVGAKPIYIDTRLDLPEAREHALKVVERYDGIIVSTKDELSFRSALRQLGMPGMDFRRCTQLLKISPVRGLIGKNDTLIVGLRAAESSSRRREPVFGRNRSLGVRQVNPIIDRTSLDVFLYARYEGIELNPLYYKGMRRLGCRLCPASKEYDLLFLERNYPSYYRRLRELVDEYAQGLRPDKRRRYFKSGRGPVDPHVRREGDKIITKYGLLPPRCEDAGSCLDRAIMLNACVSCGACERVCEKNAIVVSDRVYVNRDECDRCNSCVKACPMVRAYRKILKRRRKRLRFL